MRLLRVVFYCLCIILISACSVSYKELSDNAYTPPTKFTKYLMDSYKTKADFEAKEMHDWNSAKLYSEKALAAAGGKKIKPEEVLYWKIPKDKVKELQMAYENLMIVYDNAVEQDPYNLAVAISSLDCWAEQQEENWQTWDIKKCRNDYLKAMKNSWTQEAVSHQSEFLSYSNVKISPKPLQKPHPPIWIGGNSISAIKRAVMFNSSWHPIEITRKWLSEEGIPQLGKIAKEQNKPIPPICPRILCQITNKTLPEGSRKIGEGSIDQIHEDLKFLDSIGSEYVIFDTKRYSQTSNTPTHHLEAWQNFSMIANKSLDLENQKIRK